AEGRGDLVDHGLLGAKPQGKDDRVSPLHSVSVAGRRHSLTSDLGTSFLTESTLTAERTTDSPPNASSRATLPPMFPIPMIAVAISFLLEQPLGQHDLDDLLHGLQARPVALQFDRERNPANWLWLPPARRARAPRDAPRPRCRRSRRPRDRPRSPRAWRRARETPCRSPSRVRT